MKLDEIRKKYAGFKTDETHVMLGDIYGVPESFEDIKTLLDMLDEAKGVIEFYGDKKNWQDMDLLNNEECNADYECLNPQRPSLVTGGKRARELLKKWSEG